VASRIYFHCPRETVAARPEIMEARSLDVTGVRNTDLSFLRANQSLRILHLSEAHSLRGIETLSQIRELVLIHIPKVRTLQPLGALRSLQFLTISTVPSWDASRKCIEVESFAPLRHLKDLVSLTLTGVLPLHGGLRPLHELTGLRALQISHVFAFALEDYAMLAAHLTKTAGPCLQPCYAIGFELPCRRCGKQMVFLTGPLPRARQQLCVDCDRARLRQHIDAWNAVSGRDFPYPESAEDVGLPPALHYTEAEPAPS